MQKPENVKQYLDGLSTFETDTTTYRVLDSAIVGMTDYYAALEITNKATGARQVTARVDVLDYHGRGDHGFCYKSMDEGMGPYHSKCPARILDLLTDAPNEYAARWREDCRRNLAKSATANTLKEGDTIRFAEPIRFVGGTEDDTFRVTTITRKGRKQKYLYSQSVGHASYSLAKQREWSRV